MIYNIFILIITHVIGDIVLQWSKMDQLKKDQLPWLLLHVGVYSAIVFVALYLVLGITLTQALYIACISLILHLLIDFIFGKIKIRYEAKNNESGYVKLIVIDQALHIGTLLILFLIFAELDSKSNSFNWM